LALRVLQWGHHSRRTEARTKKFAVKIVLFAKKIPKDPINDEIAARLARPRCRSGEKPTS
jgi:hypothetical protein